MEESD